MIVKSIAVAVIAGLLCVSCGPKDPAAATGGKSGKTLAGAADTTKAPARKGGEVRLPGAPVERVSDAQAATATGGANLPDTSDMPLAPKDAQWTIYCATVPDQNHVETSRALKAALIKRTGMREWYILHESDRSRLYYGFYRSIDNASDAAETKRAQTDRKKIDELVDGGGQRPFRACQFVQLNAPDPESRAEWNLVNAPEGMVWTLIVGAYKDSPDRKQAAVDAVREAREKYGEQAFYYHGDVVSNVCIGLWPDAAVIEERDDPDPNARRMGHGDLFVLPPGVKGSRMVDKRGKPVSAVSQRLVAVDDTLKAKIQQYPTMLVNGEELMYKKGGTVTRRQPSIIAAVPRPAKTLFAANPGNNDGQGTGGGFDGAADDTFSRPGYEDNAGVATPTPPTDSHRPTGSGKLRSLGNR
jgi:hypothetical protein